MSESNHEAGQAKVNAEVAKQATDIANFIANNPGVFARAFVEGMKGFAAQVTSTELDVVGIGPHDAIQAMERLNLTEPTTPGEGEVLIGGDSSNDLRLNPAGAAVIVGTALGIASGRSLIDPIETELRSYGGSE